MALSRDQAIRLSQELRSLRESTWPDKEITQAQLAQALSAEGRVAPATVSSWESPTTPKTPSPARLDAYARFFSSERSIKDEKYRLLTQGELRPDEFERYQDIESKLLELHNPDEGRLRTFHFDAGPVIVICPTIPEELQDPLSREENVNFTKLRQYGDLDALVELVGFLRAENPGLEVAYKLTDEVNKDDFSGHIVLLGGIGWNSVTLRFQRAITQVPITQVAVDDLKDGDIFVVDSGGKKVTHYPTFDDFGNGKELTSDVGLVARVRNPFAMDRTLTICNGIHSRGVVGAVRCLTDPRVRGKNEQYIADNFPEGEFALLVQISVVANETLSPDLHDQSSILYRWSPNQDGAM